MRNTGVLLFVLLPLASSRDFLGANPGVDRASVHQAIEETLRSVLGQGHSVDTARLAAINATLSPLFNVLPKNPRGRLDAPFMRYAIQRYFSQRHGWIVKGFEPHANKSEVSETQGAHILESKVPSYLE